VLLSQVYNRLTNGDGTVHGEDFGKVWEAMEAYVAEHRDEKPFAAVIHARPTNLYDVLAGDDKRRA